MQRIGRITSAAAAIALMTFAVASHGLNAQGEAAPYQEAVGTKGSCNVTGSSTAEIDGSTYDIAYTGEATFETLENTTLERGQKSTTLNAVAFSATSDHPELGTMTWTLVPSTAQSTITANTAESDFPATSRLSFFAEITISSQPDAVYRSDEAVVMVNTDLTEWPHNNAEYTQEKDVRFTEVKDATKTMTVTRMTGTVTAMNKD